MAKRCSHCGEAESVIELTQIESGEVNKIPLCAKCAAEKGIQTSGAGADTPLGGLLAALAAAGGQSGPNSQGVAEVCPGCGAGLDDFRQTGRLGCEQCYQTFAEPLRELLRRVHGADHHHGRGPAGTVPGADGADSIPVLKERLRQAIAAEQFERAAEIRDRLRERQ
ncbi:MAG: hypothetical protein FJ206_12705 [Gemmatimonadetes bacterium]|nr:hypothetical protein [Gemmatimonadota bacterium]